MSRVNKSLLWLIQAHMSPGIQEMLVYNSIYFCFLNEMLHNLTLIHARFILKHTFLHQNIRIKFQMTQSSKNPCYLRTFFHGMLRSVALILFHFITKHNYFVFFSSKHENQASKWPNPTKNNFHIMVTTHLLI